MAARTNNSQDIEINYADHWVDDVVRVKQQRKQHITKIMVCTFTWRQNIGHLGSKDFVCGVHGHRDTMAQSSSATVYNKWWDDLAEVLRKHEVKFLGGDFNMSLTQDVPELTKRGLQIDACAWYSWLHESK